MGVRDVARNAQAQPVALPSRRQTEARLEDLFQALLGHAGAVELVRPRADQKGVSLSASISDRRAELECDPRELESVFVNLLVDVSYAFLDPRIHYG